MSADDLLAGPAEQIDVAHLAAEHRAACDEIHRLRDELRRIQRVVMDAELLTDCEDLCLVLCAGPCQGENTTPIGASE